EKLPEPLKSELERLKDQQQELEKRTNELLQKMAKVADDRASKDLQTAEELRAALEMAKKGDLTDKANLPDRMRQAREQLGQNRVGEAAKKQEATLQKLDELVKELEDRREAELERLTKKMRQAEKELEEILNEQEKLQKKAREAEKIADEK